MHFPLPSYFAEISWFQCELTLCNTWSAQAREHPLSIFDAIFKFATKSFFVEPPLMLFHPRFPIKPFIEKGQRYSLELIFPLAKEEEVHTYIHAVRQWLADTRRHFVVESCSTVIQKNVHSLMEDFFHAHGTFDVQELCLNFISPVPHMSSDKSRKRYITAEQLMDLCLRRIERLYGFMPQEAAAYYRDEAKKCTCLPWMWKYEEFHHKSKSTQGTKYIHGFMGPLWMQGHLQPLLPLLLLCENMHIGRRLHSGQGAFQLHRQYAFGDTLLQKASLWHQATQKYFPQHIREDYTDIIALVHTYGTAHIKDIPQEQRILICEVLAQILLKPLRQGYAPVVRAMDTLSSVSLVEYNEELVNALLPLADTHTRNLLKKVSSVQQEDVLQNIIIAWDSAHR